MRFPVLAMCLILAACGADEPARNVASDFVPPAPQLPAPIAGQAQTTPLSAYVGHYPNDPVDGVTFFDRTEVATALESAVTDAELRRTIIRSEGPGTPIFRTGRRIASQGCEAHACDDHQWTVIVDPASGKGEVCVREGGRTLWHSGGPPVARPGECPSPLTPKQAT